jgi:hypothetical protein
MKNKLTNKFLAVAIILVSLNAFSIALTPFITISTNHVSATVDMCWIVWQVFQGLDW